MHYSLISVVGNGENEIDDQQTSDAILSINYRDKVGYQRVCWLLTGNTSGWQHQDSSRANPAVEDKKERKWGT